MYYGKINKYDIANGDGVRVSLFVSGCRNRCPGCFNPETWNFKYGKLFDDDTLREIIAEMHKPYISGISILGGDPFEPENLPVVWALISTLKIGFPDKTVWIYTGYKYETFKDHPIMKDIDVLVDGRFIEAEKDITLKFRGSRNQRVIDVQASRLSGSVITLY